MDRAGMLLIIFVSIASLTIDAISSAKNLTRSISRGLCKGSFYRGLPYFVIREEDIELNKGSPLQN